MKCPGQDTRKLTVSYHPCPVCGKLVEFFSDELMVKCRGCGAQVNKEQIPSCIQWCSAARSCVGEKKYDDIMQQMEKASMDRISGKRSDNADGKKD